MKKSTEKKFSKPKDNKNKVTGGFIIINNPEMAERLREDLKKEDYNKEDSSSMALQFDKPKEWPYVYGHCF